MFPLTGIDSAKNVTTKLSKLSETQAMPKECEKCGEIEKADPSMFGPPNLIHVDGFIRWQDTGRESWAAQYEVLFYTL